MPMDASLVAILLVLALAFANGTNDVSKAIATLVGSGGDKLPQRHRLGDGLDGRRGHGGDL